jgi:hypothetical protein
MLYDCSRGHQCHQNPPLSVGMQREVQGSGQDGSSGGSNDMLAETQSHDPGLLTDEWLQGAIDETAQIDNHPWAYPARTEP